MSSIKFSNISTVYKFGVTSLPDRVNKALYIARGANLDVVAYFRDDDCAKRFEKLLTSIEKMVRKH